MTGEDQPSIGFICPLYTEVKAVLETFDKVLAPKVISGAKYYYGMVRHRKAVAVTLPHREFGPVEASRCASKLISAHPSIEKDGSYCFLVGVAGGIWSRENDVRLGDVVIATRIWDWRSGKTTKEGFVSTKYPERAPAYLLRELGRFLYDRSKLGAEIQNHITRMQAMSMDERWNYPGQEKDVLYDVDYHHSGGDTSDDYDLARARQRPRRSTTNPRVHDGLVASGNTVLKESINRERLQQNNALAVEMEACGMPENFIVIRGVSDYADSHKNDIWQPYAAATAAACARLMIDNLDEDIETQNITRGSQNLWNPSIGQEVRVLKGHTGAPMGVAFSPDGSLLASASYDKTVRLWNTLTGRGVTVLEGHTDKVWRVAFSPDGSLLASASGDKTVRLCNPSTGRGVRVLEGHTHLVYRVAFSPGGSLLASASYDETVRLWDPWTGRGVRVLEGHTKGVMGVAFSHDDLLLASASAGGTVQLWSPSTGQKVKVIEDTGGSVGVAFSPDGSLLASASYDKTVRLWNTSTCQQMRVLEGHTDYVWEVAFSPDGSLLASASGDRTVRLWNPPTGRRVRVLEGHTD